MHNIFGCSCKELFFKYSDDKNSDMDDEQKNKIPSRESYNYVSYINELKHIMRNGGYIPNEERTRNGIEVL